MANYIYETTDGDYKLSTNYSCEKKSFSYTTISDEIKVWFDFLLENGSIANNLDEMLSALSDAANIQDGFYFENGAVAKDIQHVYDQIRNEVSNLKGTMVNLHNALDTDIDNINAELKVNFGHWIGAEVKTGKTTKTKTTEN